MKSGTWVRRAALSAVIAVVFAAQGCSSVGRYFQHRYHDFGEMIDLGVTVTRTPQLGLYWNSLEVLVAGYSNIDGYFAGFGGGQIGVTRVYSRCWGLAYGEETIGWGPLLDSDQREDALVKRRSGVLGIATSLVGVDVTGSGYGQGPNYTPACVHFVPHLGYIGLVWNARYTEMADFALGWFGLDIAGDDGYPVGKWSFPRRAMPPGTGHEDSAMRSLRGGTMSVAASPSGSGPPARVR